MDKDLDLLKHMAKCADKARHDANLLMIEAMHFERRAERLERVIASYN